MEVTVWKGNRCLVSHLVMALAHIQVCSTSFACVKKAQTPDNAAFIQTNLFPFSVKLWV